MSFLQRKSWGSSHGFWHESGSGRDIRKQLCYLRISLLSRPVLGEQGVHEHELESMKL